MATMSQPTQALSTRRSSAPALSPWLLAVTSLIGLAAFFYPFLLPPSPAEESRAHVADTPLLLTVLMGLCVLVLLADLETRRLDAKQIALLGMLIATNAALRPLQGLGGLSPLYILPILTGYVYGGGFGFLLGALSVLVSALFTGGVGVWLPFQMFGLGWVGLLSAWLARPGQALARRGLPERWTLAGWGLVVGLGFGALLNLYFWPFIAPAAVADPGQAWDPASGLLGALRSYLAFYVVTSLWYDVLRALGNVALLLVLAEPMLKLLRRFQARFLFTVLPAPQSHVESSE
jgi:energy-coupling factor transport system substrate-specific component